MKTIYVGTITCRCACGKFEISIIYCLPVYESYSCRYITCRCACRKLV